MATSSYDSVNTPVGAGSNLWSRDWNSVVDPSNVQGGQSVFTQPGLARSAYFDQRFAPNGGNKTSGIYDVLNTKRNNNSPVQVTEAAALWEGSVTSKGMFVMSDYVQNNNFAEATGISYGSAKNDKASQRKYGFNFHYNPRTVSQSYAGMSDFDFTMFTSGKEAFNLINAPATQSTVSFDIVLNRIHDRQFFDPNTEELISTVSASNWSGRFPVDRQEQRELYKRGTMYDVEFFLRTVMQIPIPSFLEQRNIDFLAGDGPSSTADMGFLTGIPVELHIGRTLRYLVRVDSFQLNHIIFSEDMVPLFTNMSITASRIPDFSAGVIVNSPADENLNDVVGEPPNQTATNRRRLSPSGAGSGGGARSDVDPLGVFGRPESELPGWY